MRFMAHRRASPFTILLCTLAPPLPPLLLPRTRSERASKHFNPDFETRHRGARILRSLPTKRKVKADETIGRVEGGDSCSASAIRCSKEGGLGRIGNIYGHFGEEGRDERKRGTNASSD